MRQCVSGLLLILFGFAASAGAQTACPSAEPCVQITFVGQACFVVRSLDTGVTVVTDPPAASVGYTLPETAANAVTVSHNHSDHNNVAGVRGSPAAVDGRPVTARQEVTAAGLPFVLIPGFHDNRNGAERGPNTIARWTQSGITFAHFGDIGQEALTAEQLADVRGVDVMFVPAGGFFTVDAARAAALIEQVRPRFAILMHFRTALGGPAQLATFPAVVAPFRDVFYAPSPLTLTRLTAPIGTPVAVLMEVAAEAAAVNAASFSAGTPVAPGSLVSLFGRFTNSATASAAQTPLPRRLGETEVLLGTAAVPLLYVSPTQVNLQLPREPATGQLPVEVRVAGQRVARGSVTVVRTAPGIFGVLNQDNQSNSAATPARRGSVLQIFGTGQGEVSPVVEPGEAAPAVPLAITPQHPEVSIGGTRATVVFSGLAPRFAGLWQINIQVPADSARGPAVPLTVAHGGFTHTIFVAVD